VAPTPEVLEVRLLSTSCSNSSIPGHCDDHSSKQLRG
jgi:hypothetical protein